MRAATRRRWSGQPSRSPTRSCAMSTSASRRSCCADSTRSRMRAPTRDIIRLVRAEVARRDELAAIEPIGDVTGCACVCLFHGQPTNLGADYRSIEEAGCGHRRLSGRSGRAGGDRSPGEPERARHRDGQRARGTAARAERGRGRSLRRAHRRGRPRLHRRRRSRVHEQGHARAGARVRGGRSRGRASARDHAEAHDRGRQRLRARRRLRGRARLRHPLRVVQRQARAARGLVRADPGLGRQPAPGAHDHARVREGADLHGALRGRRGGAAARARRRRRSTRCSTRRSRAPG